MDPITIDFETEAIVGNPLVNPPRAVGVAIWAYGKPRYLSWGHPTQNSHPDKQQAGVILKEIFESKRPLLFHNAGFDLSVAMNDFGVKMPSWERIHDTMYLLFLSDPYASTLSLKPSADRYLGMAATEQSALYDWILANVPGSTPKTAGAYIARAPGSLVSPYACGDVERTRKLFDLLYARIVDLGMKGAYEREQRLFPLILDSTRRGIRVNRDLLCNEARKFEESYALCTERLANRLGCNLDDLDHDNTFADALDRSGAVKEWVLTPKSKKRSLSRDNLKIEIPEIKVLMDYRGALETCLQTFIRPWINLSAGDGRLHPNWNQVKQAAGERGKKGTQTGRLSSDSPNFQNVPTEFSDSGGTPYPVPDGFCDLPLMRRYCLPEPGHVWLKRDFSSQEIRILAHFEDGSLCEAYRTNPELDPHEMARGIINGLIGVLYARKDIKITGFSIIYGTGVTGLSLQLGRAYGEAAEIKDAYFNAMPGIRDLMRDVQRRGKSGQPIRTWGGRVYYAEPPKEIEGRLRDFAYKLLNYLIQGSAADQTKEALCNWWETRPEDSIFLATVHDEINISAPKESWKEKMKHLKDCMNADRFDVPMLSEGFVGPNWADIEKTE